MNESERPEVICHVLSGIDGRISGSLFGAGIGPALAAYREIWTEYDCDAILNGAVTCSEIYADGFLSESLETRQSFDREDYIADRSKGHFVIAVDTAGTLNWRGNTARRPGQPEAHIVQALTENVGDGYLAFLREQKISYVFAGKDVLDLGLLLQKLKAEFGIRRVLLTGGGVMDYSFLAAGYLDELSLVIAPAAGGDLNTATVFDRSPFQKGGTVGFGLKEIKQYGDAVHLRYTPNKKS